MIGQPRFEIQRGGEVGIEKKRDDRIESFRFLRSQLESSLPIKNYS